MTDVPDLLVKGRFLFPHETDPRPGVLAVRDGRVVALADAVTTAGGNGTPTDAADAQVLDFGERLVTPGAIDVHVHFRDPGHPQKEDFGSGTASAAFGGVTTVLDMPNTDPPTTDAAAFAAKKANAAAKAVVDFGLYAGIADEASLALLPHASAVKLYLGATTGSLLTRDRDLLAATLTAAAAADRVVAIHAEDQACLDANAGGAPAPDDWASHSTTRPNRCEAEAVWLVGQLASTRGTRVHVAHLSTQEGLAAALAAGFTSEVTPHHLTFTAEDLAERGGVLKMNPPLRSAADRDALWDALRAGSIDCVASDHAPHTTAEKAGDVAHCPAGVPGVETMVPMLVAAALEGEVPLARVFDAACRRPAEIFGLPKGRFDAGLDADFAVWDLDRLTAVRAEHLHSRAAWTPFEDAAAVFPTDVWSRGRPVITDGNLVAQPGSGRFLAPRAA